MADAAPRSSARRGARLAIRVALADLRHDRFLTVVGIVLLAALIAPPLVLHAIRVGLVETWAQDLARDIRNREVVIIGENSIGAGQLAEFARWPETDFVVPEPSFFVSTQRARKSGARGSSVDLNLRTTAPGDPVMAGIADAPLGPAEVVLSARAAEDLGVGEGDQITLRLARTPSDASPERVPVELRVAAVIAASRWAGAEGFVTPQTLLGFRNWLTFLSDVPTPADHPEGAVWQSLRIYAPTVANAPALQMRLDQAGFETRLMTDQVDRILKLETGLRQIFSIVLALSGTAFVITAFLLQWLSYVRKKRDLALRSVIGMTGADLTTFAVFQGGVMTALGGLVALGLVGAVRGPVETIVHGYLSTPAEVESPALLPLLAAVLLAVAIGALAGIGAVRTLRPHVISTVLRGD
ncbi:MAG: hypothetical protein IE922_06610 [Sphingomonadales bacterium]|nr:hypothetical protein [Sphingomonadales bacterium]